MKQKAAITIVAIGGIALLLYLMTRRPKLPKGTSGLHATVRAIIEPRIIPLDEVTVTVGWGEEFVDWIPVLTEVVGTGVTDSNGEVYIAGIPPGEYYTVFERVGFKTIGGYGPKPFRADEWHTLDVSMHPE